MKQIFVLAILISTVYATKEALDEFVLGNRKFTADVYKEVLKLSSGNFLVSPLSAETVLALALEGSNGETSEELIRGLKFPSTKEKTSSAIKSLLPQLNLATNGELELQSTNKMYVNKNYPLKDNYKLLAKSTYMSEVENINFAEGAKAASAINKWVDEKTNHKINKIVEETSLTNDVKVVLINTLYFLGKWLNPFDTIDTLPKKFFLSTNDSVVVETMHTSEYFNYYENKDLQATFLEMPYAGGDATMTIVLPDKNIQLADVEQKLEEVLKPQPYKPERVAVAIPKFSVESQVKFVPILKNMGIKKAFTGGEADFSGIGGKKGDLYISDIIQKTFINVTETGTEAASATAGLVLIRIGSVPPNKFFDANHPFLFYLRSNDVILFIGKVDNF
ncbi:unnamed protein product [Brassicogethes aeneus]|uniref:Serpin domain-containing protein n=1 Tax=Brassicogethes aeneus TaxID=1431903 RepID=A0A9P0B1E9_BRAAE|nr:unnamed protein product [Brassicogethes aeneus]